MTNPQVPVSPVPSGQPVVPVPTGQPIPAPQYGAYGPVPSSVPVAPPAPSYPTAPAYGAPGPVPAYGVRGPMPAYGSYGPPQGMPSAMALREPQPGHVPLRPMRLGEILSATFGVFRHNPAATILLPLVILLVASLLGWGIGNLFSGGMSNWFYREIGQLDPELTLGLASVDFGHTMALSIGSLITGLIAAPIVAGLLAVTVSRSALGDRLSVGDAWARVRSRIPALIGWGLLEALLLGVVASLLSVGIIFAAVAIGQASIGGGILFGILAGLAMAALLIWLTTRLLLIAPAIALENLPFGESLRRGWNLTRGSFWRIFGIYLLGSIIFGAISGIFSGIFGGFAGLTTALNATTTTAAMSGGAAFLSWFSTFVSTLITSLLTGALIATLYLDTRMRREGLADSLRASAGLPPVTVAPQPFVRY